MSYASDAERIKIKNMLAERIDRIVKMCIAIAGNTTVKVEKERNDFHTWFAGLASDVCSRVIGDWYDMNCVTRIEHANNGSNNQARSRIDVVIEARPKNMCNRALTVFIEIKSMNANAFRKNLRGYIRTRADKITDANNASDVRDVYVINKGNENENPQRHVQWAKAGLPTAKGGDPRWDGKMNTFGEDNDGIVLDMIQRIRSVMDRGDEQGTDDGFQCCAYSLRNTVLSYLQVYETRGNVRGDVLRVFSEIPQVPPDTRTAREREDDASAMRACRKKEYDDDSESMPPSFQSSEGSAEKSKETGDDIVNRMIGAKIPNPPQILDVRTRITSKMKENFPGDHTLPPGMQWDFHNNAVWMGSGDEEATSWQPYMDYLTHRELVIRGVFWAFGMWWAEITLMVCSASSEMSKALVQYWVNNGFHYPRLPLARIVWLAGIYPPDNKWTDIMFDYIGTIEKESLKLETDSKGQYYSYTRTVGEDVLPSDGESWAREPGVAMIRDGHGKQETLPQEWFWGNYVASTAGIVPSGSPLLSLSEILSASVVTISWPATAIMRGKNGNGGGDGGASKRQKKEVKRVDPPRWHVGPIGTRFLAPEWFVNRVFVKDGKAILEPKLRDRLPAEKIERWVPEPSSDSQVAGASGERSVRGEGGAAVDSDWDMHDSD